MTKMNLSITVSLGYDRMPNLSFHGVPYDVYKNGLYQDFQIMGIQKLGINIVELEGPHHRLTDQDFLEISAILNDRGITIRSIHNPSPVYEERCLDLSSPDKIILETSRKIALNTLHRAELLGVPIVVMHMSDIDVLPTNNKSILDSRLGIARESLEQLLSSSNSKIRIAIENDVKNAIFSSLAVLKKFIEKVSHPRVGVCLDIGHSKTNGVDMFQAVECLGDSLLTTHVHENDGKTDYHNMPDFSEPKWAEWIKLLQNSGYSGTFHLEVSLKEIKENLKSISALKNLLNNQTEMKDKIL